MTENNRAEEQAELQVKAIKQMVAALNVDYDRLEELRHLDEDRAASEEEDQELRELEEAAGDCADREQVERRIHEDALSIEVCSGWYSPGGDSEPEEYRILLCVGGPSCQIVGTLDEHNEPETAEIQYQGRFTQWSTLPIESEDEEALLEYARQFYFGE